MITNVKLISNRDGSMKGTQAVDGKTKEAMVSGASQYQPQGAEKIMRTQIVKAMEQGVLNSQKPRHEFFDLSLVQRAQIDKMSFNAYQPNNGEPLEGDVTSGWRSNAMRPIVRNKIIGIAAHATQSRLFPKIHAVDSENEQQEAAADVMSDLYEWAANESDYDYNTFLAIVAALFSPAAIIHTEYGDVYREIKEANGSTWVKKMVKDIRKSGFRDTIVPVEELFICDFYTHDIQDQPWIIWRRILTYDQARLKHASAENWKYVKPGLQIVFSDPNNTFYEVYDSQLRGEYVEELLYWNKSMDLYIPMVNGVILADPENPNPRIDKQYPFSKFGYELIDAGRFFYYKSLAFKTQQDANIINTMYPMFMDSSMLANFPPMKLTGGSIVGSDVIVPGYTTTLSSKDADLQPIFQGGNQGATIKALSELEQSINQSSEEPIIPGGHKVTAYEINAREKQSQIGISLFLKMIAHFVKSYGQLRLGDIIQHLTVADIKEISGEMTYKMFMIPPTKNSQSTATKKITFDGTMPDKMSHVDHIDQSYEMHKKGEEKGVELYRVNPALFRELTYILQVTSETIMPPSDDLQRQQVLELYDRMIMSQNTNQEEALRMLIESYPSQRRHVDKLVKSQEQMQQEQQQTAGQQPGMPQGAPQGQPQPGAAPGLQNPMAMLNVGKKSPSQGVH